ncbi:hypothetical protein WJX72_004755 [[Myrmecia] bisecta]|uniref:Nitroreductase domain-containing protein n=1 Tax=[Myrmecia] bisecta TaxID=41462 RepID=A0AAW1R6U4_9CHLO
MKGTLWEHWQSNRGLVLCAPMAGTLSNFDLQSWLEQLYKDSLGDPVRLISIVLVVYLVTATPMLFWVLYEFVRKPKDSSGPARIPSPADTQELIRKRRSVFPKDYTGEPVDRAVIGSLLEAANWAPTHGKTEPWRFVVLGRTSQETMIDLTLDVLRKTLPVDQFEMKEKKINGKRQSAYPKVPYMIAICMKRQANPDKVMPEWEEMSACACAVQNMALMATAHGLAGYWTSWTAEARESPEMKQFLLLQPDDRCLGFFMLGKSDRIADYRTKRGPVAGKTQWRN